MSILQTLLLAVSMGMGTWVIKTQLESVAAINELRYQLREANRGRWSISHQAEYNAVLGTLNTTIKTPDVRKIAKEIDP